MKKNIKSIIFTKKNTAICQTDSKTLVPPPNGALIQTHYSCISAGTEISRLTGLQPGKYPFGIGSRAIGRVIEVGSKCNIVSEGDLAFVHIHHTSYSTTNKLLVKLHNELDRPEIAQMGMAMVAFTGIRVGHPEMGDTAVVVGARPGWTVHGSIISTLRHNSYYRRPSTWPSENCKILWYFPHCKCF